MLKISQGFEGENTVILKLEGKLVDQWVNELEKVCETNLARFCRIILDFSGVSFIDDQGIKTVHALNGDRISLTGCSLFLTGLLSNRQGGHDEIKL